MAQTKAQMAARIALEGEREFKSAVTNINSEMKMLSSEMKKVTSEFVGNEKSVESLTAKNKVLRDQVEKQTEKIGVMREALAKSTQMFGESDKKTLAWKTSLNNAEAQLNDLNREIKNNENAMRGAQNPAEKLGNEFRNIDTAADSAGGSALKMSDIIKANLISAAIINGVKQLASAFKDLATDAIDVADQMGELAGQTGFSVEELQAWKYVGYAVDTELTTITGSLSKLIRSMSSAKDETGDQADAFKKLGVSVKNSDGSLRNSRTVLLEVIDALSKMTNETDRDALSMTLFGKSAMEMNPLIKAGSDEIERLTQAAYDNGAVMSEATVNGLDAFKTATEQMGMTVTATAGNIISDLMPSFMDIINWINDNRDAITAFAKDVLGQVLQVIKDTIKWVMDNPTAIKDFMDTAATAINGVGDAIEFVVGFAKDISDLWNSLGNSGQAVVGLGLLAAGIWNVAMAIAGVQSAWSLGIAITAIVAGLWVFKSAVDAMSPKGVKRQGVSAGNGFGGSGGVAWNAEGAIFTKPTIFATPIGYQGVGEAGPEAVLPLNHLRGMIADEVGASVRKQLTGMSIVLDDEKVGSFVDNRLLKAGG